MTQWIIGGIVVLIVAVGGYVFLAGNSMNASDSMMESDTDGVMMEKGAMTKDETRMEDRAMKDDAMKQDNATKQDDAMMKDDTKSGDEMMKKGSYSDYAPEKLSLANNGKVLLYFHADWCPLCRPLDAEMKAAAIPSDVHILKVNYDTATSLKQKYGVTYQHTFVQVDAQGNMIAKWGDATTLAAALARVK